MATSTIRPKATSGFNANWIHAPSPLAAQRVPGSLSVAFAADLSTPAERGRTLGMVTSGVVIGILGAGFMGAGVGYVSALNGLEVVLIDRDQASADKGKAHAKGQVDASVAKGRMKAEAGEAILARPR